VFRSLLGYKRILIKVKFDTSVITISD